MTSLRRLYWTALLTAVISQSSAEELVPATPESQGVRSEGLRAMSEWVRSEEHDIRSLIVLRNGKLILEWYASEVEPEMNHNVFSITKSIVSTLAGIALAERKLENLEVTPEDVLGPGGNFSAITLTNLLTMRSGLPQSRANLATGPVRELFDRIAAAPDRLAVISSLDPTRSRPRQPHHGDGWCQDSDRS
ncbi:MAG: serine hydrolase, partial [Verrucomicrobiota bacterium]